MAITSEFRCFFFFYTNNNIFYKQSEIKMINENLVFLETDRGINITNRKLIMKIITFKYCVRVEAQI
jgi:hypothetical protein